MISTRRRLLIIFSSVALGSIVAAFLMQRRFGTLKQENVQQLILNFIFAVAIVVGIGILLSRMNSKKKDKNS